MDSVAAQPSSAAQSTGRHSASRLVQLLNPLRKANSAHDMEQLSGYEDYAQQSQTPSMLEGTDGTPTPTSKPAYSPHSSFGFSSKTRISRAPAEGGSGAEGNWEQKGYYIPYRGPISPPTKALSTFASPVVDEEGAADQQRYLQTDRQTKPLPEPNPSGKTSMPEAPRGEIPRYIDVESHQNLGLGLANLDGQSEFSRPTTGAREQAQTGSAAATGPSRPARSLLGAGLPSAYTHGGNAPVADAGRSLAYQSYLPSLLRFDRDKPEHSMARKREVVFPTQQQHTIAARPTFSASQRPKRANSSASGSPTLGQASLNRVMYTSDRNHHAKAGSLTSSDGHGSSLGNDASASTSMTSLRDHASLHGSKSRTLLEGPPPSASAKLRPRANTVSSASEKSKQLGAVGGQRELADDSATSSDVEASIVARDYVSVPADSSLISLDEKQRHALPGVVTSLETSATPQPLSPIAASTPGLQSEVMGASHESSNTPGQIRRSKAEEIASKEKRFSRMNEAHRKYLLLQQLHLDELAAHAPDHAGWLDTKNGCERVLMPKPSLKETERGELGGNVDEQGRLQSTTPVTFERHRRPQARSSPQLSDQARAQEILSSQGYTPMLQRGSEKSPLFHHRMPPSVPHGDEPYDPHRSAPIRIPPRRSSKAKRKTETLAPGTSGFYDDDDDDLTPDLVTVLAQGRALEEERERWRNQHRRSVGRLRTQSAGRSKGKEGGTRGVRHSEEPLPDLTTFRKYAGPEGRLHQTISSPNLRSSSHRMAAGNTNEVPSTCMAFLSRGERQQPAKRGAHQRSKSQDGRWSPDSNDCFPSLTSRRRAKTMTWDDEKTTRLSMPWMHDIRNSMPSARAPTRATPSLPQLVSNEPVIIGSQSMFKAKEQGQGATLDQQQRTRKPDAFGVAFSAPRPDIGHSAPKDPTFQAGRHATKLGYHRPTNSDDLRFMLASHGEVQRPSSEITAVRRKPVGSWAKEDEASLSKPSMVRNDSLGMSLATATMDDKRQAATLIENNEKSLPVPPRKQRASGLSGGLSFEPLDVEIRAAPLFGTPFVAMEGFSTSDPMSTPTLGQAPTAERGEGSFFELGAGAKSIESGMRTSSPSSGSSDDKRHRSSALFQTLSERRPGGLELHRSSSGGRLAGRSSSSSESSSYSPKSVSARELWNTDEHAEESFSSLFLRRPTPGSSALRNDITMLSEGRQHQVESEVMMTPRQTQPQEEGRPVRDSMYRISLHGRRNSQEVGKVVGSYLDGIDDGTLESTGHEPAWNDSSIELPMAPGLQSRPSMRMGRVDGRLPTIQRAQLAPATSALATDEMDAPDQLSTRPRTGSFAASLVLTGEDGADESPKEQAPQPQRP